MLNNKKLIISADTILNEDKEDKISTFSALLDINTMDLSMTARQIDKEACKEHRDVVRADQAKFEDLVYAIQDMLKSSTKDEEDK